MYSVVLMMALSGGGDGSTADAARVEPVAKYGDHGHKQARLFGRRRCHGCCGGGYVSCCGGGGYGCCGGGHYGSYGGGGYYGSMPYVTDYYGSTFYSALGFFSTVPSTPSYTYGTPLDNTERVGPPLAGSPSDVAAPATLTVRLPADAKLSIQGAPTTSTKNVRTFISPPLQPGKAYEYTLRATVTRDGKPVERTRTVKVRAGQQNEVIIDLPAAPPPK